METVMENRKIADMTLRELRDFIIQTIQEFADPDAGLVLRPEVEEEYPELTTSQAAELNRRIDSFHANPGQGRTWNEIKSGFDVRNTG